MAVNAPRTITISVISDTVEFPENTELKIQLEGNKKYLGKDVIRSIKEMHPQTIDTVYLLTSTGHMLNDFSNMTYDTLKAIIIS